VYNKFVLNNQVITDIKTEEIQNFLSFNIKKNYMYDPNLIIIYDDITNYTNLNDASGTFGTDLSGTTIIDFKPQSNTWTNMAYRRNPYLGFNMYNLGVRGKGIEIAIPVGCNVLWLTSLADRFMSFKICDLTDTVYGIYAGGRSYSNGINPGGTVSTLLDNNYSWIPIPLYWLNNSTQQTPRKVRLYSYLDKSTNFNDGEYWVSKIAFTTNLWNHVLITPQMMYYDTNSTTYIPSNANKAVYTTSSFIERSTDITYDPNWSNSGIIRVRDNTNFRLRIPIIKSGKNKILYFISINRSYTFDVLQVSLVNSDLNLVKLDNLKSTFSNPFATHYNSKILNSYRATIIPDSLITLDSFRRGFVTINIFLPTGSDFYIRELGTHDEN
jgi:hypothetical protein